jgi:hypothetical protein
MNKWNLEKEENQILRDGLWVDPSAGTEIAEASSVPLYGPAQPDQPTIQLADQAQPIQQLNPLDLNLATQVLVVQKF